MEMPFSVFAARRPCFLGLKIGVLVALCLFPKVGEAQDYPTQITVAQDGSGDFRSIQTAVDHCKSFPDHRITIQIKSGIYREKVKIHAWNTRITLLGDDPLTTILSWDDHFEKMQRGRNSTFFTPTLLVQGDGFRAKNLSIENAAGPVGQAIALALEADECVLDNCRILGHHDTFYAAGSRARAYLSNCYIEGTTDFIFGPATVFFDRCQIHSLSNSYITAASTPKAVRHGFVFRHCRLTAAEGVDSVFLGRPWRDHAKVVFVKSEIGAHILPAGWANWEGTERDKTAFFAEGKNRGAGAGRRGRVVWSRALLFFQVKKYTPRRVLGRGYEE